MGFERCLLAGACNGGCRAHGRAPTQDACGEHKRMGKTPAQKHVSVSFTGKEMSLLSLPFFFVRSLLKCVHTSFIEAFSGLSPCLCSSLFSVQPPPLVSALQILATSSKSSLWLPTSASPSPSPSLACCGLESACGQEAGPG